MIGTLGIALLLGHLLGDFMIQQHTWSARKAEKSWAGQSRMALHVFTYTAACWAAVYAAVLIEGLDISHSALAVGIAVNAATHWVLDLRWPLVKLVRATGHGGWLDVDKRALFIFDQVVHAIVLLLVAFGVAAAS